MAFRRPLHYAAGIRVPVYTPLGPPASRRHHQDSGPKAWPFWLNGRRRGYGACGPPRRRRSQGVGDGPSCLFLLCQTPLAGKPVPLGGRPVPRRESVPDAGERPVPRRGSVPDAGERPVPRRGSVPDAGERPVPRRESVPDVGERPVPRRESVPDVGERPVPRRESVPDVGERPVPRRGSVPDAGERPCTSKGERSRCRGASRPGIHQGGVTSADTGSRTARASISLILSRSSWRPICRTGRVSRPRSDKVELCRPSQTAAAERNSRGESGLSPSPERFARARFGLCHQPCRCNLRRLIG
jgi:hypothetical protein